MIRPLALAAAILAGGALAPAPASAAVRFDPATNTGFVDSEDVRKAFGWDAQTLVRNAPEIGFTYHVGKEEIYSLLCDREVRAGAGRNPGSTSAGLVAVVTVDLGSGELSGFRITGTSSGASSIGVPPAIGQPCPVEGGGVVRRVTYVHTTTTEALSAEFRDVQVYLTQKRTVSKSPPPAAGR
ncbi:hypothetical protein AB0G04_23755 [Actinoplanes sp. NPDC023801]|uniref:hypothetical protein n=1 Tax=Actinoplanes sp. NPDC023801 TaxID=3154595 RepID=UPI0033E7C435